MGFGKEAWCGVVTAPGTASRQFAKSWRGDGGPLSQRLAWKQEMSRSVITLAIVRDRARASARLSPSALCCTILHCTTLYYTKALARGSTTSGTKGRWGGEGERGEWMAGRGNANWRAGGGQCRSSAKAERVESLGKSIELV